MAATTLSGPLLSKEFEHGGNMQYTLIVILLVLWLMGEATDHTFGGLLHILFLAALVVCGISLVVERRLIINEPH